MDQNQYTYETPVCTQPPVETPVQAPSVEQVISSFVEPAFGKALAATIMAWFPVASIIALVMGKQAMALVDRARDIANQYGIKAGGRYMAARTMATIGKFGGLAMTIFWALYTVFLIIYVIVVVSYLI